MKGIILAGGAGTRLHPLTKNTSKQLLPVFDKPMIYYPLTTLMLAGIEEFLIITAPQNKEDFVKLLGDGAGMGISINYAVQEKPEGLPQGLLIGEDFLAGQACAFILGDNLFYGSGLGRTLRQYSNISGAHVFAKSVPDPQRFGIIELDKEGQVLTMEEKPTRPKSSLAITGLYFLDNQASSFAKTLNPSSRGELEMIDLLRNYQLRNQLQVSVLPMGTAWLDTGTFDSLNDASNFVRIIQQTQGIEVGDPYNISIDR